ncbi:MAG TPA: monofunctional biosynthetic peptidoglycan transglycosylase, partial [Cytophagaceae bacterium]|nr:monofunctional biosynthetic peptidoglycan transglycosylase [Cytophagaceae bacterium]
MKEKLAIVWNYLKRVILFFFLSSIGVTILYRFFNPPITYLMLQRVFEQWSNGKDAKMDKEWKQLGEISPSLPIAVVASEDQLFMEHWGFDFKSIEKAYENNQKKKRRTVRGASTISQQVAKNVFLWPGRSWIRKGLEVYFTLLIEVLWDKPRIMEVYLNVTEMGDGIYGVERASRNYFKRGANKVSRTQAALIAAILPNPRKYSAVRPS